MATAFLGYLAFIGLLFLGALWLFQNVEIKRKDTKSKRKSPTKGD